MQARWIHVCSLALLLLAAGCITADQDGADAGGEGTTATSPNESPSAIASEADQPQLWIGLYTGIPAERIEPHLPDGFVPARCFEAPYEDHEVLYFASEDVFHDLPDVDGDPVRRISLATCVDAPDRFLREEANEPDWFAMASWTDHGEFRRLLQERGRTVEAMSFDGGGWDASWGFEARDEEGRLLGGAVFASPDQGLPAPLNFVECEPVENVGRALEVGRNGTVHALDWTKRESTCLAEGTIGWDEGTTVAEILGPGRSPDWVFHTSVEEAVFSWKVLGPLPGASE